MNIFICFGYNNDDKWIKDLVFPLVESFDATILTGEDLHGDVLSAGVTDRIKNRMGCLPFLPGAMRWQTVGSRPIGECMMNLPLQLPIIFRQWK
jgi:hypothetical protein